ncbi:MAG: methyl-accepting chemotaxis protein [Pseudomonadota bacterium]
MRLIHRFAIIAIVPLVALVILASMNVISSLSHRSAAVSVAHGVEKATLATGLVHRLQAERGASAGYLTTKGSAFRSELAARRDSTNEQVEEFLVSATTTQDARIVATLDQLSNMRTSVDTLNADSSSVARFYTNLIEALIQSAASDVGREASPTIGARADAFLAIVEAKERAGRGRSAGNRGFGAGRFTPEEFEAFTTLIGAKQAFVENAINSASESDRQAIQQMVSGPTFQQVESFADIARQSLYTGDATSVTGPQWFAAASSQIDEMYGIEGRLANTLLAEAKNSVAGATGEMIISIAIAIASFTLTIGSAFLTIRSILGPLTNLKGVMARLSGGDYKAKVPAIKRHDEIGDMARSLRQLRDELAEAEGRNKEAMFKGQAFDNTLSAMIMVDTKGVIQYVNEATKHLFRENYETFNELFPGFDTDDLIGKSFDGFHTNPAHQQSIVSDPTKLPYKTQVSMGDLHFSMVVNGVFDKEGNHVGCILSWEQVSERLRNAAVIEALSQSQALIEFTPDGIILDANKNFLETSGYTLEEIQGQHHRIFMPSGESGTAEYAEFWDRIASGKAISDKFRHQDKDGRELWLHASYNPLKDPKGNVYKVLKIASDITESEVEKRRLGAQQRERETEVNQVIEQLAMSLKQMASGDLMTQIDQPFTPTFEVLRTDYNDAIAKFRDALGEVVANAKGIHNGSSEISQAADDLSKRTENQAATLEETAASLEQLTASVRAAAEGAANANEVVSSAQQNAESSGAVVREAVSSMNEIESSSKQISQIIGVIDDIAFQTNLLALNAGVEAARAGDAGRGFAVVASEVRALAQRSSDAAKEIKTLISSSSSQVERGVELVGQAGMALEEIVGYFSDISSRVSEIASSSNEQSSGIAEINVAINQLDQVTQQNAAMVEQSTAASHSLSQEADRLLGLISQFQLGNSSGGNAAAGSIHEQQERVREFVAPVASSGGGGAAAAVQQMEDDWENF